MSRRRALVAVAAAGSLAALLLRRRERRRDSVTIGYGDGSAVTLEAGGADADRLLELARPAVGSA
jgi:hypothetical protein